MAAQPYPRCVLLQSICLQKLLLADRRAKKNADAESDRRCDAAEEHLANRRKSEAAAVKKRGDHADRGERISRTAHQKARSTYCVEVQGPKIVETMRACVAARPTVAWAQ